MGFRFVVLSRVLYSWYYDLLLYTKTSQCQCYVYYMYVCVYVVCVWGGGVTRGPGSDLSVGIDGPGVI